MATQIPQPPSWPIVGNMLNRGTPAENHAKYGPIYQLQVGAATPRIYVCSVDLLSEICNERSFIKDPKSGGLFEVRNATGSGLFTAFHGEENWELAHRILMPALGNIAIKSMFDEMYDISSQLVLKWARLAPGTRVSVTEDFTRLTLDTIALCTMDTRFNSFYSETFHPFVNAMVSFLKESGARTARPSFLSDYVYKEATRKYWEDVKSMRAVARQVIETRRSSPSAKKDLVDAMINGVDPKTGKTLPEENVIDNMITFLIAGHETTSGLLSFVFYELLKNPSAMKSARAEVDAVLGQSAVSPALLSQFPYLNAVIRETLRLHPTAPAFSVTPKSENPSDFPDFIGKEKYPVHQGQAIVAILDEIHRDPSVYGDDADQFKPERMLDEPFNKLPRGAWKPFGNGARSCIGRAFALQEATMTIALLLQNFEFELADPHYQLIISKTLTVKPKDFEIFVHLRPGLQPATIPMRLLRDNSTALLPSSKSTTPAALFKAQGIQGSNHDTQTQLETSSQLTEIIISYGSNTGTCQALAHTLASEVTHHGFAPTVICMDDAAGSTITNAKGPLIVITASYEGQPPENAMAFTKWLTDMESGDGGASSLAGHIHAVYGCGHRDWVDTFQRVPTLMDTTLRRCGSRAVVERGVSDAADDNVSNEFDSWADQQLWPALEREYHPQQNGSATGKRNIMNPVAHDGAAGKAERAVGLEVVRGSRAAELHQDGREATVLEAYALTAPGEPEKRHLKVRLPEGMKYAPGDYLAILPVNHDETIKMAMTRFGLTADSQILTNNDLHTVFSGAPRRLSVYTLLREFVELNHPASAKNVRAIIRSIPEECQKDALEKMSTSKQTWEHRPSVLHLLQLFPTAALSFAEYIVMLPPLHVRQYSISSSPREGDDVCTVTYSVLRGELGGPSRSADLRLFGAASTYLAELKANDRLWVSVRPSHLAFHPPEDLAGTPTIMICAGSGLAPFRAFIQERAAVMRDQPGKTFAKWILFIGCRNPEKDALYAQELRGWEKQGVIELKYAYSGVAKKSESCKYVQELLWKHRKLVLPLITDGNGKMFVCGASKMVDAVSKAVVLAYAEKTGKPVEEADMWFRGIRNDQFASDVFN